MGVGASLFSKPHQRKDSFSGKAIEWSRLDRRGDDVPGNERLTFRRGRVDVLTRWDWINWWLERRSEHNAFCSAREQDTTVCIRCEELAVFAAYNAGGARLCTSARTGLQDQSGVRTE